ncbi:MAG TPA: hypothetical protein VF487_20525 [Chitinophagaceae bacterium]
MKNKILVYDDNCPLCSWYSSLFTRYGFLPPDGRVAFSILDPELLVRIDVDKSRNEIPLLDTITGEVVYGIDALLEILGQRFTVIKTIGHIKPVNRVLKKLYKLISFNRKVIVAKKCSPGAIDCAPDMNYFYRILFMLLFLVFNTVMLYPLHNSLLSRVSFFTVSINELLAAHFFLFGINCLLSLNLKKQKSIEYLGQVNMLALIGILLLLPIHLVSQFMDLDKSIILFYLTAVTIVVFREYIRRMEYASVLPTNKWIATINFVCMGGFILFLFI